MTRAGPEGLPRLSAGLLGRLATVVAVGALSLLLVQSAPGVRTALGGDGALDTGSGLQPIEPLGLTSWVTGLPVLPTVLEALSTTLMLAIPALAFVLLLGGAAGLLLPSRWGRRLALPIRLIEALPPVWTVLAGLWIAGASLTAGVGILIGGWLGGLLAVLLPVVDEASHGELAEAERARGLPEGRRRLHGLWRSLPTLLRWLARAAPGWLGTTALAERGLGLPGLGRLLLEAVARRDGPVVAGAAMALAACSLLLEGLAVALAARLDPRGRP